VGIGLLQFRCQSIKSPREQWTFGDKETEEKQNNFFFEGVFGEQTSLWYRYRNRQSSVGLKTLGTLRQATLPHN
jgi:hypothetical protein